MRRLFIVEDEAIIAMDLAEQLEEFGYDIIGIAHDGQSALNQLKDLDPDLILMDIVLGNGIDGIETSEIILQTRSIPIIFLTAFSDAKTVDRAAKTAPYGYITKPYNVQALRASIEIALTKNQLEHKLLYKERWFSNILHAVHDGVIAVGIDGKVHFVNAEACRMLEIPDDSSILNKGLAETLNLFDAKGAPVKESPIDTAMQQNVVLPITFGGSIKNSLTGNRVFIDYTAAPVRGQSNNVIGGVLAIRDASLRLNIESAIRNSDDRFQTAFEGSSVGIALVGFNNDILESNAAFSKLLNLSPLPSEHLSLDSVVTSYSDKTKIKDGLLLLLSGEQASYQHEMRLQHNDQQTWIMINISLLHDHNSNPVYYFYQVYDLTDRKRAEHKLYHLANYDTLTGLINLPQIKNETERLLELCEQEESLLAIITFDIDQFKSVNDRFDLAIGDQILAELAMRLKDIGHYNQLVGRPGGDRFVLILHTLDSVNQAMFAANRALEELREPFYIGVEEVLLSACAGIAFAPDDGTTAGALLDASEEALHVAKANGKNQITFYNKAATVQVKERINNEVRIHQALDKGLLTCHVLPVAPTDSNNAVTDAWRVKLLCYWPENNSYLEHSSFIDISDHTGLPQLLIRWLVTQTCEQLGEALRQQKAAQVLIPFYSVLRGTVDVAESLAELIRSYRLDPGQFIFEFSEDFISDRSSSDTQINAIRAQGFGLSIDHTHGYSVSVALLHELAPDYYQFSLRDGQSADTLYLKAIIALTQSLNIPLVLTHCTPEQCPESIREKINGILPPLSETLAILDFNP